MRAIESSYYTPRHAGTKPRKEQVPGEGRDPLFSVVLVDRCVPAFAGMTRFLHRTIAHMAFLTDKEELKPGLVIFRRGDVQHRNWYCRVKLPRTDRGGSSGQWNSRPGSWIGTSFMLASRRRIRPSAANSIAVRAVPIARIVARFILEAHRDAVVGESP